MERLPEYVEGDIFYPLTINGGKDGQYMVSAKYDRLDYVPRMGAWLLKIFDDDEGVVTMHISEEEAYKVQDATGLPIVCRDTIMKSEYDSILNYKAQLLTDEMFGINEDEIRKDLDE